MRAEDSQAAKAHRLLGVFSALCVVTFFTGFVLASKIGLRGALLPTDLLVLRFAVAGVLMLPLFLRYRLCGLTLLQGLSLAMTGGLGFAALAYAGFALAPASHGSSLIHGTLPMTTVLIAWLAFKQPSHWHRVVSTTVIFVGVMLLVAESLGHLTPAQLWGDTLLLAASFLWSTFGLLTKRYGAPTFPAAAIVAVLSAVLVVPLYLLFLPGHLMQAGLPEIVWQGLFQGVAISIVGLLAYSKAVSTLGAANTALFAAGAPALTTLVAIPLLGEHPGAETWAGVLFVTFGIVASAFSTSSHKPGSV
jgi:drug/metabolite transporter (DMT)-like permease